MVKINKKTYSRFTKDKKRESKNTTMEIINTQRKAARVKEKNYKTARK